MEALANPTSKGDYIVIKNDIMSFYGGSPEVTSMALTANDLVAYRSGSTFTHYIVDPIYINKPTSRPLYLIGEPTAGVNPKINASLFVNAGTVYVQNLDFVPDIAVCLNPTKTDKTAKAGPTTGSGAVLRGSLSGATLSEGDIINDVTNYTCYNQSEYAGVVAGASAILEMIDSSVDMKNVAPLTRGSGTSAIYAQYEIDFGKELDTPTGTAYRNNPYWGAVVTGLVGGNYAFFENVTVKNKGRYAMYMGGGNIQAGNSAANRAYIEGGEFDANDFSLVMTGIASNTTLAERIPVPAADTTHTKSTEFLAAGRLTTKSYPLAAVATDTTADVTSAYSANQVSFKAEDYIGILANPEIVTQAAGVLTVKLSKLLTPSAISATYGVELFQNVLADLEYTCPTSTTPANECTRLDSTTKINAISGQLVDETDYVTFKTNYRTLTTAIRQLALFHNLETILAANNGTTILDGTIPIINGVTGGAISAANNIGGIWTKLKADVVEEWEKTTARPTGALFAHLPATTTWIEREAYTEVRKVADGILGDSQEGEAEDAVRAAINDSIFEFPELPKKSFASWSYGFTYDYDFSFNYEYDYAYTITYDLKYENPFYDDTALLDASEVPVLNSRGSFTVVVSEQTKAPFGSTDNATKVVKKSNANTYGSTSNTVPKTFDDMEAFEAWLAE